MFTQDEDTDDDGVVGLSTGAAGVVDEEVLRTLEMSRNDFPIPLTLMDP